MNKDLENLLDECNVIEYKQEVSEGLFKSISAFSNTDGGCIILGVEDETKNIVGIDLSNGKQEALTNKIIDLMGIQPNVELLHIEDKDILKIIVEKSSVPIAYKNKYYKRVGNTTREANKEELKKLLLKDISWDSITNNFTLDDIDESELKEYFIEFDKYDECRFGSRCIHENEPSCAVKEAVENGDISKKRYESYIQLLNEIRSGKRRY